MQKSSLTLRYSVLVGLVLIAAFSRVVPHMFNFSPLGAISLFGAAHFNKKWQAILVPVAATWLSDLFLNNVIYTQYYSGFTWIPGGFYWQYGSYVLIVLAGLLIFRKVTFTRVLGGALAATVIFFLLSNFGVWLGSRAYPQNFSGLMACYAAGVPFLKGTILGNLVYSAALFGTFAYMQKKIPALQAAK